MKTRLVAALAVAIVAAGSLAAHAAIRKPTFTVSSSTSPLAVSAGQAKQYKVNIKRVRKFKGAITLKVKRLPPGAVARWTLPNGRKLPRPRRGSGQVLGRKNSRAVLTISTAAATPAGRFKPVVDARSGRIKRSRKLKLEVAPPAGQSLALWVDPGSRDLLQGDRTAYDVTIVRGGGLAGAVDLGVAGLPEGVTASFSPAASTDAAVATLLLEAAGDAPVGSHAITITATAGAVSATAPATLVVKETKPFTIAGDLGPALTPGASHPLDLTLTNPHDFDIQVVSLGVTPVATDAPGCAAAANFSVSQVAPGALPVTVHPGSTSLSALGLAPSQLPQLAMLNLASNQDACRGARVELRYAGSASRP